MTRIEQIAERTRKFGEILVKFPEVRYVGDSVLHKVTEEVSIEEGISIGNQLGDVLMRYRKEVGYGRGFAAPQIGLSKAVYVTFIDGVVHVFINPRIIERARSTNFLLERCLSSGTMDADVERPEWIVMEWTDKEGVRHGPQKFEDVFARIHQHENDHLKGVVNVDVAVIGGIEFSVANPLEQKLRKTR